MRIKVPFHKSSARSKNNTRFVLMVGDEGGILVYLRGNTVLRRLFVATPEPSNTRAFNELLDVDAKAPLLLLIDMMDQNFIRQTLPPVSRMSVGKLVQRRISKDLSPDDVKGFIMLDREKKGRKDWNYMLVSTPGTGVLKQWIDYAVERINPFDGIFLLPLEAEPLITQLAKMSNPESAAEWQLLVSHNKVGGYRQIVLRQGKMVFTRMALPIGESVPEVIAGNIEQEIINTMEYLKRMGYQDTAGLDVYNIVSQDIKSAIDTKKIPARSVTLLTPYEAAARLELEQSAQPDDHFGDVVISAYFGGRKKTVLQLQTPYTRKLATLRSSTRGLQTVTALLTLVFVGLIVNAGIDIFGLMNDTEELVRKKRLAMNELTATQTKAKQLPGNIEKISDIVSLYKIFDVKTLRPLYFIKRLSDSLDGQVTVEEYKWNTIGGMDVTPSADHRSLDVEVRLRLANPPEDKEEQKTRWLSALDALKKQFADFTVKNTVIPGQIGEEETFQTNFGQEARTNASTDMNASVTVNFTGPKPSKTEPKT